MVIYFWQLVLRAMIPVLIKYRFQSNFSSLWHIKTNNVNSIDLPY
jgi:hypothetical protein